MKISRLFLSKSCVSWPLATVLVLGFLLTGCAKIRLVTYPGSFVWLDQQNVQDTMHSMYQSMQRLKVLSESDNHSKDSTARKRIQNDVINELQRLESIASGTVAGTSANINQESDMPVTNHLLIDEHMDEFISQISKARFRAQADPPGYFEVGQLVGECNACHRNR